MITLVPVGELDPTILKALSIRLETVFGQPLQITACIGLPEGAWDPQRQQYLSARILARLPKSVGKDRVLGMADVDLYAEDYDYVFGEAEVSGGRRAIISVQRLWEQYYGRRRNKKLFEERMVKEAVHELGHTWGLGHCDNLRCVMRFSISVEETDLKLVEFCAKCWKRLESKITPRNGE